MKDTIQLIADLARVLPPRFGLKTTPQAIEIYERHLADLDPSTLEAAVEEIINTKTSFPTIREIRETAAEIQLALPRENEALAQVERRILWRQQDELSRGPSPEVHPAVKEALDHVGGFFAFRSAEKPDVVRGQFLRLYREIREQQVDAALRTRPQQRPAIEAA